MIKVVVDTNVIVSGLHFEGKPRIILDLLRTGIIQLCISQFIINETREVLSMDFDWSEKFISMALEQLTTGAIMVEPDIKITIIKAKDDDNRILECASAAGAEFLISGDKRHILPLGSYNGIKIVSPDEFLNIIKLEG